MAHSFHHALSSARIFGGTAEDYLIIHNWLDATKCTYADFRHRALRHHTFGIFEAEEKFGITIMNSAGNSVPVRLIAEQHVREDCNGRIPTVDEWLRSIRREPWMNPSPLSQNDLMRMIDARTNIGDGSGI